jgi:hypothetical protein
MNILKMPDWQKLLKWLLAGGWCWLVLFGEKIGTKFLGGSAGIILLLAAVHALMGLVLFLRAMWTDKKSQSNPS